MAICFFHRKIGKNIHIVKNINKYTLFRVLFDMLPAYIFVSVFHRILDFKTGLDFYPGPFFCSRQNITLNRLKNLHNLGSKNGCRRIFC